jgi:shikimate kinase
MLVSTRSLYGSIADRWSESIDPTNPMESNPTFLYIRGEPGTGKYTVAKILADQLGWTLFWLHDLDPIFKIVGDHRVPRLIDELVKPIIHRLLQQRKNIIYVRPSREAITVTKVRDQVALAPNYNFKLIHLTTDYDTQVKRVCFRDHISDYRVSTRSELAEYLVVRPNEKVEGEITIDTGFGNPEYFAKIIKDSINVDSK